MVDLTEKLRNTLINNLTASRYGLTYDTVVCDTSYNTVATRIRKVNTHCSCCGGILPASNDD